jgi:imidazolonepropionase-like amidohydrolase
MSMQFMVRTPGSSTAYPLAIDGTSFAEPTGDEPIELDTSRWWALPGLADAHAHLTMQKPTDIHGVSEDQTRANIPAMAWAQIDRGVLLILDKGGASDITLLSLELDPDVRPHLEVAGALIHPDGGYVSGFGAEVEPEDLVDHIRATADVRGGWVKIIGDWPRRGDGPRNNYSLDRLTEAVEVAHTAGARVAVHAMAHSASDAVAAGVDSIEHGPFLTPEDLAALAARGGAWVPTIVNMLDVLDFLGADSSGGRFFLEGLARMRENLPLAEELGVTVLAGTDMAVPHGEVAVEAVRLREYGLSDRAAARAASLAAYEYVGRSAALRPGDPADIVFFPADPFDDVSVLAHPTLIIRNGTIIRSGP